MLFLTQPNLADNSIHNLNDGYERVVQKSLVHKKKSEERNYILYFIVLFKLFPLESRRYNITKLYRTNHNFQILAFVTYLLT